MENVNISAGVTMCNCIGSSLVVFFQNDASAKGLSEAFKLISDMGDFFTNVAEEKDDIPSCIRVISAFSIFACRAETRVFNAVWTMMETSLCNCMPPVIIDEFKNIVNTTRKEELIGIEKTTDGTSECAVAKKRYI